MFLKTASQEGQGTCLTALAPFLQVHQVGADGKQSCKRGCDKTVGDHVRWQVPIVHLQGEIMSEDQMIERLYIYFDVPLSFALQLAR